MLDQNRRPIHELNFFQAITRPGFVRFLLIFILLIIVVLGMYWYFSPRWEKSRQALLYEEYLNERAERNAILAADTFGGSTPQETMNMFIAALEAGDPELAAKYFALDDNGSRAQWRRVMIDTYEAGKFPMIAEVLKKAQPEPDGIIGDIYYAFSVRDENGDVVEDVGLIFNGHLWKIKRV